MNKRYSKEEVVELMYDYRKYAWENGLVLSDCRRWLRLRGFIDKPTEAPNNKRKQYSVQDEIERKERIVEDNTPSYDKVMKAIDRAEDRGRMNSKHIHTLQQAVNTLLDDKIEGTWWSRLWNRNN